MVSSSFSLCLTQASCKHRDSQGEFPRMNVLFPVVEESFLTQAKNFFKTEELHSISALLFFVFKIPSGRDAEQAVDIV